jgi:hypothetical protein
MKFSNRIIQIKSNMNKIGHILKTLFVVSLFSNLIFSQGLVDGYMKGKGNTDIALSYTSQNSTDFWGGSTLYKIPRKINAFGLYIAHGFTSKIDVIANVPFINGEFQDAAIMFKFLLLNKSIKKSKISILPAFGLSTPMMNYQTGGALAIGQRATQILSKLILQFNLENGFFFQTQSGYNYTLNPVPSSIPFSCKIGLAKSKIYADIWFDYQQGLGSLDYPTSSSNFRKLTVDYQRFGGVVFYSISSKIGAFVNYAYSFTGRNTSKSYAFGIGGVLKFTRKVKKKEVDNFEEKIVK